MTGDKSLIFATWMGVFIYGYLNAMLGIVLPNLMEKLQLDKSRAALFFMMNSIGLIVASIPSGLVMDVLGTKVVVLPGPVPGDGCFLVAGVDPILETSLCPGLRSGSGRRHGDRGRKHGDVVGQFLASGDSGKPAQSVFRRRCFCGSVSGDAGAPAMGILRSAQGLSPFGRRHPDVPPGPFLPNTGGKPGDTLRSLGYFADTAPPAAANASGLPLCGNRVFHLDLDGYTLHH